VFVLIFIYAVVQRNDKNSQRSVTHASQTAEKIILSTTTTTATTSATAAATTTTTTITELFPQPSRHCCSDHCNNRKSNVLKHAVYIHCRNHTAVKTHSRDTMPVGVTIRLHDGR